MALVVPARRLNIFAKCICVSCIVIRQICRFCSSAVITPTPIMVPTQAMLRGNQSTGVQKLTKMQKTISREQIDQGKRFFLSWKVRENEFCRVVGTISLCISSSVVSVMCHIRAFCLNGSTYLDAIWQVYFWGPSKDIVPDAGLVLQVTGQTPAKTCNWTV